VILANPDTGDQALEKREAPGEDLDPPGWLFRVLGFKPAPPIDEDAIARAWKAPDRPGPDVAGVAELLRIAEATVEDERARGRALDTKAATLVGFTGLILSAETALTKTLFSTDLGRVGTVVARCAFFLSMIALLYSAAVAVAGVLMPQKYRGLGRDEIRAFRSPDSQAMSELAVRQAMLGAVDAILWQDRPVNDFKAKLIKRVGVGLLVGFAGLATQGLTIGLHHVL
jgi:hypothetical protein